MYTSYTYTQRSSGDHENMWNTCRTEYMLIRRKTQTEQILDNLHFNQANALV